MPLGPSVDFTKSAMAIAPTNEAWQRHDRDPMKASAAERAGQEDGSRRARRHAQCN